MFGFVNLNKPVDFTSHDCIAKLRKLLNTKKIGHGGTLDPAATGVLPIAIGKATRLLQFLPQPKAYRARIRLGVITTTDDLEGEVIKINNQIELSSQEIIDRLKSFQGVIQQVPPVYSAIKQNGKKLYQLARKGETVTVEPRTVSISKIELLNIYETEFYELEVEICCSAGTYIRAIARDLGAKLGVGGTLASLVRTQSCGMHLQDSLSFADIEQQLRQNSFELIEPQVILSHLNSVVLNQEDAKRWCQGQLVDLDRVINIEEQILSFAPETYLVTYGAEQVLLGISILFTRHETLKLKPKIVCYG